MEDNRTTVRSESSADHATIADVHRLAFGQDGEARLVAKLRRGKDFAPGLSLVALRARRVVGHILFSPVRIESSDSSVPALALAPMAVLPEFQRQGIGSQLVREGLEACRRRGHRIVVVLGHPDYYPRFGFLPAPPLGIRSPFPAPDEAFMVLALIPGALDGVSGMVCFPPCFSES